MTQVADQVHDSVFARDLHTNYAILMQVYRQHRLGVRELPDRNKKNKRSRLLLGTNGTIVATAFPVKILGTMCIASPKALRRSSSDELINRYELVAPEIHHPLGDAVVQQRLESAVLWSSKDEIEGERTSDGEGYGFLISSVDERPKVVHAIEVRGWVDFACPFHTYSVFAEKICDAEDVAVDNGLPLRQALEQYKKSKVGLSCTRTSINSRIGKEQRSIPIPACPVTMAPSIPVLSRFSAR